MRTNHPNPLFEIHKSKLSSIDDRLFIDINTEFDSILDKTRVIYPVFFVTDRIRTVECDSPHIGMVEWGPTLVRKTKGPFTTIEEATKIYQKLKNENPGDAHSTHPAYNDVYDGKIITRFLDKDINPHDLKLTEYFSQFVSICKENYYLENYFEHPVGGNPANISDEKIDQLYDVLYSRAMKKSKEKLEYENGITAIFDDDAHQDFVKLQKKLSPEGLEIKLESLSSYPGGHEFRLDILNLGLPPAIEKSSLRVPHLSFEPIKFSIAYSSVSSILKEEYFID